MHEFKESKLLEVPLKEAYELVLDLESYYEFLPHIEKIQIISKEDGKMLADMFVKFGGMRQTYRSEILHYIKEEDAEIDVKAIKGIFKYLHNNWNFTKKGDATMIKFDIKFEFASKLLNAVAGPVFDNVSKQMISAFETRVMEKYGKI